MLVLQRDPGQSVVLILPDGTEIKVMVVCWHRAGIRLGFEAPKDVKILRSELLTTERKGT